MKKKGINKQLLEAELKKYKLMSEYSFYVPDNDDDDRNLLLGSSVNEELRTYKFYLVLKFIYSKYKDLIYNQQILKEIENYIEMYEISKSIKSFKSGEDLLNFCVTLEFKIYERYLFQHIKSIDEFVNKENMTNVIVIDEESHAKNQYICYMKE
jgi:hypothetical protein